MHAQDQPFLLSNGSVDPGFNLRHRDTPGMKLNIQSVRVGVWRVISRIGRTGIVVILSDEVRYGVITAHLPIRIGKPINIEPGSLKDLFALADFINELCLADLVQHGVGEGVRADFPAVVLQVIEPRNPL